MTRIKEAYYNKYLDLIVRHYTTLLQNTQDGECLKIMGLALPEMKALVAPLKAINSNLQVVILSDIETGPEFIKASKLIELRNEPAPILALIPSNTHTSAEDSYNNSTFKDLDITGLNEEFLKELIAAIPPQCSVIWSIVKDLFQNYKISQKDIINYLLFVELERYSNESWGNGFYLLEMIPDRDFYVSSNKNWSFVVNREKCASILCNFALTPADRAFTLPLKENTLQRDIYHFLNNEKDLSTPLMVCERIYSTYPVLNFANWDTTYKDKSDKLSIFADIIPGKNQNKELVKDETGRFILNVAAGKKGKVKVQVTCSPAPKDNPDIVYYEFELIDIDGFAVIDSIKKAKIPATTGGKKVVTVTIPGGVYTDGEYLLRVRALDANKIPLDLELSFKEASAQNAWLEAHEANPNLTMEQFRLSELIAYSNETLSFTITTEDVDIEDETGKRAKVDYYTEGLIQYRISRFKDRIFDEVETPKSGWEKHSLISTYQFDFSAIYAYQIQLSNKLIAIERTFLKHSNELGRVCGKVLANPTADTLQTLQFSALEGVSIPDELIEARKTLFALISASTAGNDGVIATTDISRCMPEIKNYFSLFSEWLKDQTNRTLTEEEAIALQNLDTVFLNVEMPDGSHTSVKLISPIHPLRLAWLINQYELYQDWEEKTQENNNYIKDWSRKLDKLFCGGIPMDIAPLILTEGTLKTPYQYVGELTFGWGIFLQPSIKNDNLIASEFRQIKSYVASVLNVVREKQIDSDVSLTLVKRHIASYAKAHPYSDKLVINLFNAGDASVFAQALVEMEKIGQHLNYEIRLFSDDTLIKPGEALKDLLNPESSVSEEAEVFCQASENRLFPKLRFSCNSIDEFISGHDKYQAHLSFLINPFPATTVLAKPDELARSFYLNGIICRSVVSANKTDKGYVWNRYYSEKVMTNPATVFANEEIGVFSSLQALTGRIMTSTLQQSVPATSLCLTEQDAMLLSFIHDVSDWVITFDKNMGPEFYDLPCNDEKEVPYLLDYVPGQDSMGISSFLTTRPTSEVEGLMIPHFKEFGINIENKELFRSLLEDLRTVSSSLLMQVNSTQNKAFEVLGVTFTKRFLKKKGILDKAFLIPIDLHKELFEDLDSEKKNRADNLVVEIDPAGREITFTVVEIKCRQGILNPDDLHATMENQILNTIEALKTHFSPCEDGLDRLDRELKTLELKTLLEFYIKRSSRYHQLDPVWADEYIAFLSTLDNGYKLSFKELGVIYDFNQEERMKKEYFADMTLYTMGKSIISEILSTDGDLPTVKPTDAEKDIVGFFKSTRFNETNRTLRSHSGSILKRIQKLSEADPDFVEEPIVPVIPVEQENSADAVMEEKEEIEGPSIDDNIVPKEAKTPSPVEVSSVSVFHDEEDDDENNSSYVEPDIDITIGCNEHSRQWGIIGKTVNNGRCVALDLNECNTISLFGVQGAGKSYTIGSVVETTLKQFSNVNRLPAPMAGVIFHYSETPDYAPEFTSMVFDNDVEKELAKLKSEYGADPGHIKDVVLFAPKSQVETRKSEYPDIEVHPIGFSSKELQIADWMFLLGATGNDSTYIRELKQIMKRCRDNMSLTRLRQGVASSQYLTNSQRNLANQRLDFAADYITDDTFLGAFLHPGRLVIVDLRDELIEKDEALGLFVVMLNIFAGVKQDEAGASFNKFIVFDEAHKYMGNKELAGSITGAIREMRHKGVSIMIASQDPMSLPSEIIELSSIVVMHRFSSPAWVKHVQKAITPLQTLTATEMASLSSGEAFLWAGKATDKSMTTRPVKINIRPRVTKHGGATKKAVE